MYLQFEIYYSNGHPEFNRLPVCCKDVHIGTFGAKFLKIGQFLNSLGAKIIWQLKNLAHFLHLKIAFITKSSAYLFSVSYVCKKQL